MAVVKSWAFDDAKELIAAMRSKVNGFGYEILVGGSVLTSGASKNDLDLFFVPTEQSGIAPVPIDLLMWLASKLGSGKTIVAAAAPATVAVAQRGALPPPPPKPSVFVHKMRFDLAGRKIDAFVL